LIFLVLHANYHEGIARSPGLPRRVKYREGGIVLWQRYGVHYRFLLPPSDPYSGAISPREMMPDVLYELGAF
jgi:hypothetical protein